MKKVGIPYEMRDGKLYVPPIEWPQRCPCCGNDKVNAQYKLEHQARYVSSTVGSTTRSSYFPLKWQVPFCEICINHTTRVTTLRVIIILLVLILPIVLSIVLRVGSDSLIVTLLIIGSILAGVILYQVLLRMMVISKMTKTCVHYGDAIFASDNEQRVFFHFYRDDQAGLFAQLNHEELMEDTKPNFWSLKRK